MNGNNLHGIFADEIRRYCVEHYIQPAREKGERYVTIRAGDVHRALGYSNRMPLVCSAIGARVFEEENNIRRVMIEGPMNGANTTIKFELL